jgi:hypothetical protein
MSNIRAAAGYPPRAGSLHHEHMTNDRPRRRDKQRLPFPYDQDLSPILRGLNRRTALGRRRLANDPVTAAYLAAAVRLIQRHLGPRPSVAFPALAFLSQRAVTAEVGSNPPPFHRQGSLPTMRDRWKHQSDFIADVLRFGLWEGHYPGAHQDQIPDVTQEIVTGADPAAGVHRLCYWVLTEMLATPMFRLGLIAAAASEGDPAIRTATTERHHENSALWKRLYQQFLTARGLRLRPGITLDDCAIMLGALADGLALRALADQDAPILDTRRRRSLLGTAALALIESCTVPDGTPAGTMEDTVTRIIKGQELTDDHLHRRLRSPGRLPAGGRLDRGLPSGPPRRPGRGPVPAVPRRSVRASARGALRA